MYTTHTYRYEKRGVVWLVMRLDAEWANRRIAKFVTMQVHVKQLHTSRYQLVYMLSKWSIFFSFLLPTSCSLDQRREF